MDANDKYTDLLNDLLIQKEILLKMIKINEINNFSNDIEFVVTFLSKTLNFRLDFRSDYL